MERREGVKRGHGEDKEESVEGMEKTIMEGRKERGGGKLSGREIERRVGDMKRR